MKRSIPYLIFLFFSSSLVHAQSYQWSTKIESDGSDQGNDIILDDSENVYSIGFFSSTADLDPGKDSLKVTAMGLTDVFVQKLDEKGDLIWAKQIGGKGTDAGMKITIDVDRNVYVAGTFDDSINFDAGTEVVVPIGGKDLFVEKLDKDGKFLWAKRIGGKSNEDVAGLSVDKDGNILVAGTFTDTIYFETESGRKELISNGKQDFFLAKLNQDGDITWVNHTGGKGFDSANDIAVDANGNTFVAGIFQDSVDFDPGTETDILITEPDSIFDIFIHKVDPDGNHMWAKRIGSSGEDVVYSIDLNENQLCMTGYFSETVDFDPGEESAELSANGFFDIFVLKLDLDGKYIWAKSIGGNGPETGTSISIDASGNIYTTGGFYDVVDFDPGPETKELTAIDFDPFILKLDTDGEYEWAKRIGSTATELGWGIAASNQGTVYTTGYVDGDIDFDPGPNENVVDGMGESDMFILKLGLCDETKSAIEAIGCNEYISPSGKLWTKSDKYVDTVFNVGGCDSIITIDLTINTIDTSLTFDQDILELNANAEDVSYQWLDCKNDYAEIEGETDKVLKITTGGDYAVLVTKEGEDACVDTSSCYSILIDGISDNYFRNNISLYPNPTKGKVNINLNKTYGTINIAIKDLMGKTLGQSTNTNSNQIILNIDEYPVGIYFLQLNTGNELATFRIVKE